MVFLKLTDTSTSISITSIFSCLSSSSVTFNPNIPLVSLPDSLIPPFILSRSHPAPPPFFPPHPRTCPSPNTTPPSVSSGCCGYGLFCSSGARCAQTDCQQFNYSSFSSPYLSLLLYYALPCCFHLLLRSLLVTIPYGDTFFLLLSPSFTSFLPSPFAR